MKEKNRSIILSGFSFFTVTVYFLLNTVLLLEWLNMQGTLSAFANVVFTVDCFTWHIYGLIAIIGFVIRFVSDYKIRSIKARVNLILHFLLMIISFFEIYFMIQNAF